MRNPLNKGVGGKDKMSKETMKTVVELAGSIHPSLGKSLQSAQKAFGGINLTAAAMGAAVATAAVIVVKNLSECAEAAKTFEKQMSNVGTLLDGDVKKRLNEMNDQLLAVSVTSGVATSDLTDGLYNVVSAFGDSAEATKQLEIAAKAAKAGNATTTDSINLLSAVTKGYGDTSAKAQQKAADLAFQTVKLGQTTFPELAASMGKVIPLAKTMSISQEELFGAMATLTGVTGGTAEVTTQLRGAVQGFLQPTKEMTEVIKAFGYADGKAMLEANGLQGSLDLLKEAVKGNDLAFAGLFSSVEAKNAVLALAGSQAENFTAKTKAMYEATGAANKAFIAQIDNVDDLQKMIDNCGEVSKVMIGNVLLPYMKAFYSELLPLIQKIVLGLPPILNQVSAYIKNAIEKIQPVIQPIIDLFTEVVFPLIGDIIQALLPVFATLQKTLGPVIEHLLPVLGFLIGIIIKNIRFLCGVIGGALVNALNILTPIFDNIMVILTGIIDFIINIFTLQWGAAWKNVVDVFGATFSLLGNLIKAPLNIVIGLINSVISGINAMKIQVPDWIPKLGGKNFELNIPPIPMLASGGFTDGLSIAGEAGKEAVISFDSAYRSRNIDIWKEAGNLLGVSQDESSTISFGDIIFSPHITGTEMGGMNVEQVLQRLKEEKSDFIDFVENELTMRAKKAYGC